jgi:MFS family permease
MTCIAAAVGVLCLIFVRDPPPMQSEAALDPAGRTPSSARDWSFRQALMTPQFIIIATAMVFTTACMTTLNSAGVLHLTRLGVTATAATFLLSMQSLLAMFAKGAAGFLSGFLSTRMLLAAGLLIECAGMLILAHAATPALGYAFAILFGFGWGTAYLAVTVLMIEYFGPNTGSALLSVVWLLTGFAALGPAGAGWMADHTGSYSAVYLIGGIILLPAAAAVAIMRAPARGAALLGSGSDQPGVAGGRPA